MEDQAQPTNSRRSHGGAEQEQRTEPVRSRWTPKPEQILILESIFNSGMVNPPKDETVRIRKLLEKFGSVGDANVFYWFQNRRSRSRRRQRQIQASLSGGGSGGEQPQAPPPRGGACGIQYENFVGGGGGFALNTMSYPMMGSSSSSSSCGVDGNTHDCNNNNSDDFFSFSGHPGLVQGYEQNPVFCSADGSGLNYQPTEVITVFINGVATEVGRGPLDMKAMFGGDFVLFHSSGVPVQVNEFGFLVQSLQHGPKTFLILSSSQLPVGAWSFLRKAKLICYWV
ncbi:hypothetical protein DH2020_039142 [Rehmannia glutinosa]|uniref:Homeobox domain-containing protein n=1 Tax=Rehmannia glutinosa TaxID=99300 RepID=A0ABR0UWM9_REHGL